MALEPEFIVCDEPVSALDVSIQAQIINLMQDLQNELKISFLFISHDLNIVQHLANNIAVMYLGRIVESAAAKYLKYEPAHPYTKALFAANPAPNFGKKPKQSVLIGEVPSPINPPKGCRFHTRCPEVMDRCRSQIPILTKISENHWVECHIYTK